MITKELWEKIKEGHTSAILITIETKDGDAINTVKYFGGMACALGMMERAKYEVIEVMRSNFGASFEGQEQ